MPYMPQQMQQNWTRGGNQQSPQFGLGALVPIGLSLAGGLLGGANSPKRLDPGQINSMFGPQALTQNTEQLYRMLMQSPAFQSIMQGGAQQGARLQGRLKQNMGRSGLGGTPMAGLMNAASMGYGSQLQRQGQTQLFMQALQQAQQNMAQQMGLFAGQQQMPNFGQQLGGALLGAGAQGFGSLF
jgi:hypothetical protein